MWLIYMNASNHRYPLKKNIWLGTAASPPLSYSYGSGSPAGSQLSRSLSHLWRSWDFQSILGTDVPLYYASRLVMMLQISGFVITFLNSYFFFFYISAPYQMHFEFYCDRINYILNWPLLIDMTVNSPHHFRITLWFEYTFSVGAQNDYLFCTLLFTPLPIFIENACMLIYVDGCASFFHVYCFVFFRSVQCRLWKPTRHTMRVAFEQLVLIAVYGLDLSLDTVEQHMLSHRSMTSTDTRGKGGITWFMFVRCTGAATYWRILEQLGQFLKFKFIFPHRVHRHIVWKWARTTNQNPIMIVIMVDMWLASVPVFCVK